jgi:hypothetical protein
MGGGSMINTSSRAKKTNISELNECYNDFFDSLKPCRFHYKDIEDPKYNLGFIFEEVLEGLISSGLGEADFRGCIKHKESGSLAYMEFVSLNTWQIQQLKPRMTAAEQEIVSLKQEIAELKSQLQKLQ